MRCEELYVGSCQSYTGVDRRGNRSIGSNTSKPRRGLLKSPLTSTRKGSLIPPQIYTHTAHGCWDELNYNGRE